MASSFISSLLLFAIAGCCAASGAVEMTPRTPEDFVSEGYRILFSALQPAVFSNSQAPRHMHDQRMCQVYCNGKILTTSECIGRTEVHLQSPVSPDASNPERRVDLYTRICEGRFQNQTKSEGETFDTSQACHGLTKLTMESEKKEGDKFVVDFSYKKTCSTRFAMTVITVKDNAGGTSGEVEVATLCEGATSTVVDEGSSTSLFNAKGRASATCNGKPISWEVPCDGVFKAKEYVDNVECDTVCTGKWRPYVVNWQCHGNYKFTKYQVTKRGYNARDRGCAGYCIISSSVNEEGYIICNGEDRFNERYSIPHPIEA